MAENTTSRHPLFNFEIDDRLTNIIVFVVLALGLIIFTFVMTNTWRKTYTYEARFSDEIVSEIKISDDDMTLSVTVKDTTTSQKGDMKLIQKDDEGYKYYQVEFEDTVVQIRIKDDELVLAYPSGEAVKFEKR